MCLYKDGRPAVKTATTGHVSREVVGGDEGGLFWHRHKTNIPGGWLVDSILSSRNKRSQTIMHIPTAERGSNNSIQSFDENDLL